MAAPHDSDANTLRFLVTTDNHLGFMERDPRRGDDSFVTFEEALSAGRVEYDCDAVLLGGDLFHENKPSLSCLTRTMALFKKYTLGSRPLALSLLSDPATTFPTHPVPIANFQDPNLNVAMPVFMIHGNHDDPIGGVSAIDTLATAGLVNYFGHTADLEDIVVRPVLLQKGTTRVAVYGLGNVRDERLHRCFSLGKVRFVRPREDARRWFSILLIHQNRGCRGGPNSKGGITEQMLLGFGFDLVIWGNEHEQRMTPTSVENSLEVIQPGSTIMTSLSAAESNPKQCGILEVQGTAYRLTPHTLRSVRPVVRRSIELWREPQVHKTLDSVQEFLVKVAEDMLVEAEEKIKRIPDQVLRVHPHVKFPLLRLAVDFTDPQGTASFPQPNLNRFGQQFLDVVVNPNDVLKAVKPKAATRAAAIVSNDPNARDLDGILAPAADSAGADGNSVSVDDIRTKIAQVFSANAKDACVLLSEPEVSHAVHSFVEKGERQAIEETVDALLQACQRSIWKSVRDKATADVTRATVAELAVLNKQERNKAYFEQHDRLEEQGGGAEADGANLLPPPPPPIRDDLMGPSGLGGAGLRDLASRSAAALSHVALGGAAAAQRVHADAAIDVDDDDNREAVALPAASDGAVIVAQHDTAAKSGAGAAQKPSPKKRGRPSTAAPKQSARKQPPAATAPGPAPLATTTTSATAAVMNKWGGGH
jgi:double-strand break repair protein MRE11